MVPRLTVEEVRSLLACPRCRAPLSATPGSDAVCAACAAVYGDLGGTWNLIPCEPDTEAWVRWRALQANGIASYRHDPEHNLSIGAREDCRAFGEFCRFDGLVLDVGCGPQAWPTYFGDASPQTRFVGVDPLIDTGSGEFWQFRAVAEHLPFRDGVFQHVVFATSLDHVVDPVGALGEAVRVGGRGAVIDVWMHEKSPEAPRPAVSPAWYRALVKPDGADDVFHAEKLTWPRLARLAERAGLRVAERRTVAVDEHRRNVFCKLGAEGS